MNLADLANSYWITQAGTSNEQMCSNPTQSMGITVLTSSIMSHHIANKVG